MRHLWFAVRGMARSTCLQHPAQLHTSSTHPFAVPTDNAAPVVDCAEVKKAVSSGDVIILDVRNPKELKESGKIPTSVNLPLKEIESALRLSDDSFRRMYGFSKPDEETPVIVLCKAGVRAHVAADILRRAGFESLKVYGGSFDDWVEKGGPVERK